MMSKFSDLYSITCQQRANKFRTFEGKNFYFHFFASAENIRISKATFGSKEDICGTSHTDNIKYYSALLFITITYSTLRTISFFDFPQKCSTVSFSGCPKWKMKTSRNQKTPSLRWNCKACSEESSSRLNSKCTQRRSGNSWFCVFQKPCEKWWMAAIAPWATVTAMWTNRCSPPVIAESVKFHVGER